MVAKEKPSREDQSDSGPVHEDQSNGGETLGDELARLFPDEKVTTRTFSLRLTQDQSDLVEKAAELRGWTPTNLIRVAALEKAAYVINTSTITSFNFVALASRLAELLFGPRTYYVLLDQYEDQWTKLDDVPWREVEEVYGAMSKPEPLADDDLASLQKAVRLGGGEYLALILQLVESSTSKGGAGLPEPIDPADA